MRVLAITGDRKFKRGHPRFDIQARGVEVLETVFWGRGSLWPSIPKESFAVVTVQDPFWRGLFAWYVARRMRAKFNIQVHTDLSAQPFFRYVLAQIVLRHADSIRVVSEKIKKQVLSMGVKASICVLPVFVDVSKFRSIIRRQHPRKRILWLGRFEEEKNPLGGISVLEQVRKEGIDAELVMLGEGSMTQEIIKRASHLPMIEVITWQKDPTPWFETADVVLCTSWHESWGASVIEALAAGIPVVAPDVGVAKEAGAIVVPREGFARAAMDVLRSTPKGELKLKLIEDPETWVELWRKCL